MDEETWGQKEKAPQRKRQKVSKVWEHYKLKAKKNTVQCLYCKAELAYYNSTTSMLQHLSRKHPLYASSPQSRPDKTR